jgi:hypothetical protein
LIAHDRGVLKGWGDWRRRRGEEEKQRLRGIPVLRSRPLARLSLSLPTLAFTIGLVTLRIEGEVAVLKNSVSNGTEIKTLGAIKNCTLRHCLRWALLDTFFDAVLVFVA